MFEPQKYAGIACYLSFIQALAFSMTPFILTLMKRKGLEQDDAGVRLLEEMTLQIVHYNAFIRPFMGFIIAYIDIIFLFGVSASYKYSLQVFDIKKAAWKRASGPGHSS